MYPRTVIFISSYSPTNSFFLEQQNKNQFLITTVYLPLVILLPFCKRNSCVVLARQKQHVPVVVAKGTSTRSTVFKAWKRAFPHLRAAALPQSPETWTYVGRHGHARWRQPAGNPACGVKSDPPAWLLPSHALPLPVRRLIVPTHPAAACRARDYSTRGAGHARACEETI